MSVKKVNSGGVSKVLVVDDDSMLRAFYDAVLSPQYDVHAVESGEEAIEVSKMLMPDLILLDVDMPGLNGYDTCRKLREFSTAPIVFSTALQDMEEHLRAFDAGGDDILTKPLLPEILLRKVGLALKLKHVQEKLVEENAYLQDRANDYLSSMGENLALLNFVRASLKCRNFEELVQNLTQAMRDVALEGSVVIRHGGESTFMTTHGEATALEQSILDKSRGMGRNFQFKRNLVVNYDKVSIIISNMPAEGTERNREIRDNIAILAETAEAFCESVDMRKVSMERAESMQIALFEASKTVESIRDKQTQLFMAVRLLLHGLTDKIEQSYSWLGTSSDQEAAISAAMNDSVQQILEVLANGSQMNEQFAAVVHIMKGGDKQNEIDLF
jgi:DNA-binding response OmpR family regulator